MAHSSLTPFRSGAGFLGGDPFLSLYRDMNRLFEDALRGASPSGPGAAGESFLPAHMNVSEAENEIRITAELPGVSQDDVEVAVDDDVLTIRAEKRLERKRRRGSILSSAPTARSSAHFACPSRSIPSRFERILRMACSR